MTQNDRWSSINFNQNKEDGKYEAKFKQIFSNLKCLRTENENYMLLGKF